MAKTKEEKVKLLENLDSQMQRMKSAVIIDYKGLKVKETEILRNILREKGVEFNISKNSLTKIALKKSGIEFDESIFKKPVAIAFAMEDEVAPAKEITLFAKKNEAIEILGGILERKFIDDAMVKQLSLLPSREQLHTQVVGTIAAPISGLVNVFAGNMRGLVNVLNAHKNKQVS